MSAVTCAICNQTFQVKLSRANKAKYCSKNCWSSRATHIKTNCLVCKKEINNFPSRLKKYCSDTCYWQSLLGKKAWNKNKKAPKLWGENHPNWTGGKTKRKDGYYLNSIEGKRVLDHRMVVEKHLGRKLTSEEIVHHINKNRSDNRIENLAVMTQSEHMRLHSQERWKNERCRI